MEKRRILLIDDEETFARSMKSYLELTGRYEVRMEHDSRQALQAAREFQPDLILLDVIMPQGDGGHVAAQIRGDQRVKEAPVVFLTAVVSRDETSAQHGIIGGHQFLAKPVTGKEVLACIEQQLGVLQ